VLLAITAYPCLDLSISSVPATDKDADGLPALQQTSMPRERLRSIPCPRKIKLAMVEWRDAHQNIVPPPIYPIRLALAA
jgi:hypothetical protein